MSEQNIPDEQTAVTEQNVTGKQSLMDGQLAPPPVTGNPAVDEALAAAVAPDAGPAGMLTRLTGVHERLAKVLETSREDVQAPIPGISADEG